MAYLGRLVGVGLNEYDRPFGVYAVSGRSEMSKSRRAITDGSVVRTMPSGELADEQRKMGDLIFYDIIRTDPESGRVVITNGRQTNPTEREVKIDDDFLRAIKAGFDELGGAEPDKYHTPRVSGIMDKSGKSALGIVAAAGANSEYVDLARGAKVVSTYSGDDHDPTNIIIPDLSIPRTQIDMHGRTTQELADNMYDWMDSELVVCSAAALWNPDKKIWELAVRNLHRW